VSRDDWWQTLDPSALEDLSQVWLPVGQPGFAGERKHAWRTTLDGRFGPDGWRMAHVVRGEIVPPSAAIREYEEAYRVYLRARPELVRFLASTCGNVYDSDVSNVYDDSYEQPDSVSNHYQDLSVRRVIAQLADDPDWPDVTPTEAGEVDLVDAGTGTTHHVPRAYGFRGDLLLQIREPDSPGFFLSPAVVPAHDPSLLTTVPRRLEWYHGEGCGHLSIEAFWQMSKVIEVRTDRFLASGEARLAPLAGL
jgi:hypothetical protein